MQIPLGQFKPALFFQVCSYGIAVSLIIIYWISQYYGHEKPFPDPSISSVAGHYPEFVIFRISTISGAVFIVLGWLTNHFYILSVAKEAVWRINKVLPKTVLIMGVMGGLALMGSSANIDTGKRNQWLHLKCAETFFLTTVLSLILNTLLSWYVQLNTRALNDTNMTAKTIVTVALIIQTYLSATQTLENNANLGNFYQWTVTFTIIAGFICMAYDVRSYKFVASLWFIGWMMVYYYQQMSDSLLRKKGTAHKFPLYTQMLKMECRKDIQTENFFLNQKEKPADSFFRRLNKTVLQSKRRIWVFVGFTVAFNLTPVYDYVMQNSRLFHRVRTSLKMEKIPESIREQGEYEE